jgi:hypothetical protein
MGVASSRLELAARLGRSQSFVSDVEKRQYRMTVIEFLDFAEAIGVHPSTAISRLAKTMKRRAPYGTGAP